MRRIRAILKEIVGIIQGDSTQQKSLIFNGWEIGKCVFNSRYSLLTTPLMSSPAMVPTRPHLSAHVRELILTLDRLVQNLD